MKLYFILLLIFVCISLFFILKKEYFLNLGLTKIISNETPIDRIMKTSLFPVKSQIYYNDESIKIPPFFFYKPTFLSLNSDQGVCGSCWAFATCNVLTDRASVFTNGIFRKKLSVQQVISCFEDGCNGGNPEDVFEWLVTNKIYTDEQYSYNQEQTSDISTTCAYFKPVESDSFNVLKNTIHAITQFMPEGKPDPNILTKNIRNMKLELILNGPFYATINVYDDFLHFSGSEVYKYDHKSESQGGHAIEIVGYCEKNNDVRHQFGGYDEGYWICRNSWSKDWPRQTKDKGYFAIVMGRNECGIESRCCTADLNIITQERPNRNISCYSDINQFYKDLPPESSLNTNIITDQ
jgi:C1A family cysteine protease